MPGCVLHITGKDFDPEAILPQMSVRPYAVFRRGDKQCPEMPARARSYDGGGFKCDVSSADGDLRAEAEDAVMFLRRYYDDLRRLAAIPTIESRYLDFGYYLRLDGDRCLVQSDELSVTLLKLCAELGIGIMLSLYPAPQPVEGE